MKAVTSLLAIIIVVGVAVIIGKGSFDLVQSFLVQYDSMTLIQKNLVGFSVVLMLITTLILVLGIRSAARVQAKATLNPIRMELYRQLVLAMSKCLMDDNNEKLVEALKSCIQVRRTELYCIAGSQLLAALDRLERRLSQPREVSLEAIRADVKNLFKAMRRDLGHSASLEEGQFLESVLQSRM